MQVCDICRVPLWEIYARWIPSTKISGERPLNDICMNCEVKVNVFLRKMCEEYEVRK